MYDHILIATDGSTETSEAVTPGFELATQHGATVHILHVIDNDLLRAALTPQTIKVRATDARQTGEDAVAALQDVADDHGLDAVTWVLRARPSLGRRCVHETIVEYAETNEVDLIVMGSTDRGRLSTMFRPSVTHCVMASTDIPVHGRRLSRDTPSAPDRSPRARPGSELGD